VSWEVGQQLTSHSAPSVDTERLEAYAEAAWDKNPIHLDEAHAKKLGYPSVIAHGMLSMGFLSDFIRAHFPEKDYDLRRFKSRFRKPTFPGDTLVCGGKIKRMEGKQITVSVWIQNQNGDIATDGDADLTSRH